MTFDIVNNHYHIYFVTARIEGGKHVFAFKDCVHIILDSLKFLTDKQKIKLFAFVIMHNHVHFLMKPLNKWTANKVCKDFTSFTAHEIIKFLEKQNNPLLEYFKQQAHELPDRNHKIWQSILAKNCYSEEFLRQKLNYIQ